MNYHCLLLAHAKIGAYQCQQNQCQVCIDYQAGITKPAYPMPTIPIQVKIDTGYGQGTVYLFQRQQLLAVLA